MPGPPKKPTAIKIAEGNPGHRPLNEAEMLLAPQEPECPDWLDDKGRKIWESLAPELMSMGVLRLVDQLALANLCDAVSIMLTAREVMSKLPGEARILVKTPNGAIQQNSIVGIINRQRLIIHKLSAEFGLTPASRARILIDQNLHVGGGATLEQILSGGDRNDPRSAEPVN